MCFTEVGEELCVIESISARMFRPLVQIVGAAPTNCRQLIPRPLVGETPTNGWRARSRQLMVGVFELVGVLISWRNAN